MRRLHLAAAILLLSVAVAQLATAQQAATDTAAARVVAERAARDWLAVVDSGRYAESWTQASTVFRAAVTQPDWERTVGIARGPFEPFGARHLLGARYFTQLPGAPPGEYVVLQFSTAVGGGRQVIEMITPMKEADGTWRVSGYYVHPH